MDCLAIKELADCSYRSEYEGNMHACGHDGHVTMLLGAAAVLAKHKDAFSGKIKFVFQPAEEETPEFMKEKVKAAGYDGAGGAAFMVKEGVTEGGGRVSGDACTAFSANRKSLRLKKECLRVQRCVQDHNPGTWGTRSETS